MILGIGTDVVGVARIAASLARHGDTFLDRVLCADERSQWNASASPAVQLALHWAAKEAALKAMGIGLFQGVRLDDIILHRSGQCNAKLLFQGTALARSRQLGADQALVSVSSDGVRATALVILHGNRQPSVVSCKQLELFSLCFAHSWARAAGLDGLQGLPATTQLLHD